ncbi:unnamed protein product [Moneuplotes crassus]|uniref:Uncharacterized protein n=1 Tax=Euplotes crassus TaxID=5936 RepID=A0AAD1Y2T9_EUPCR|nr:unnamed protein product [Moneuplotes crassus]
MKDNSKFVEGVLDFQEDVQGEEIMNRIMSNYEEEVTKAPLHISCVPHLEDELRHGHQLNMDNDSSNFKGLKGFTGKDLLEYEQFVNSQGLDIQIDPYKQGFCFDQTQEKVTEASNLLENYNTGSNTKASKRASSLNHEVRDEKFLRNYAKIHKPKERNGVKNIRKVAMKMIKSGLTNIKSFKKLNKTGNFFRQKKYQDLFQTAAKNYGFIIKEPERNKRSKSVLTKKKLEGTLSVNSINNSGFKNNHIPAQMNIVCDFHKGNAIRYKYLQEHLRRVDQQNKTYIRRKISPFLIQKEKYNTLDYHKPNKKGVKLAKTPNIAADDKEEEYNIDEKHEDESFDRLESCEEIKNSIYDDNHFSKTQQNFHKKIDECLNMASNPSLNHISKDLSQNKKALIISGIQKKRKTITKLISEKNKTVSKDKETKKEDKVYTNVGKPQRKSNSMIPNKNLRNEKFQYQTNLPYQNGPNGWEEKAPTTVNFGKKKTLINRMNIGDLPHFEKKKAFMHIEITPSPKKYVKKESKIYISNNPGISRMEKKNQNETRNLSNTHNFHADSLKTQDLYSKQKEISHLSINTPAKSSPLKIIESKNLFSGALSTVYKDSKENIRTTIPSPLRTYMQSKMIIQSRKGIKRAKKATYEISQKHSITLNKSKNMNDLCPKCGKVPCCGKNTCQNNIDIIKAGFLGKQNRMKRVMKVINKDFKDKCNIMERKHRANIHKLDNKSKSNVPKLFKSHVNDVLFKAKRTNKAEHVSESPFVAMLETIDQQRLLSKADARVKL